MSIEDYRASIKKLLLESSSWGIQVPRNLLFPSSKNVQLMKEWLRQHSDRYNMEYVILYHGTNPHIPVMEQGLLPTSAERRRSFQSTSGYVYLSATPEMAKVFGELGNSGKCVVYEVRIPFRRMLADMDQIRNKMSVGERIGSSVAESLVYGGGVRYKGKIEPSYITIYEEPHHE